MQPFFKKTAGEGIHQFITEDQGPARTLLKCFADAGVPTDPTESERFLLVCNKHGGSLDDGVSDTDTIFPTKVV